MERRKQIHEQAAQAIEALFAANLPDHYADLARHYVRSGSTPKAIDYLHLVAQQATIYDSESMRRFARVELGLEEPPPLTFLPQFLVAEILWFMFQDRELIEPLIGFERAYMCYASSRGCQA